MHSLDKNYHEEFKLNLGINSTPEESKVQFKYQKVHKFHKKLILINKGNVTFHQAAQEMLLE
ncbi:hypothetical protein PSHI8_01270 [Polynucleobacter sp. SHI8]|uniref:hypothetical protein n=1 Tax=unclassified Polynucleobacter TaxID=2640945 RepID=UPI00248F8F9E|nr:MULTISPECIES: hypothetical protein [unclassified Polynucleobacter]BDW10045.1 hypothetical protein PSHI2_01270 [Polynucleobacter sp. SHI2]BDW12491.1 hypothetical protein PSHI8_01270 [Polynucleobacter sp. SHI8]